MRNIRNRNQLQMLQLQIDNMVESLEQEKMQIVIDKMQLDQGKKELKKLIQHNNRILRNNEVFLHAIKEGTISTVKDYEQVADILRSVLVQTYDLNTVRGMMIGVEGKIAALQDYFSHTFNLTTDQYIEQVNRTKELN